jgi:hypothetical protein
MTTAKAKPAKRALIEALHRVVRRGPPVEAEIPDVSPVIVSRFRKPPEMARIAACLALAQNGLKSFPAEGKSAPKCRLAKTYYEKAYPYRR